MPFSTHSNANQHTTDSSHQEQPSQVVWQHRLLPIMVTIVVALTIFFFGASLFQLYFIHQRIKDSPELKLELALKEINLNHEQLVNGNYLELMRRFLVR